MKKVRAYLTLPICLLILLGSLGMSYYVYRDTGHVVQTPPGDLANPLTFMSSGEYQRTQDYSRTKDALYFASVGFEWVVYLFVLGAGLSAKLRDRARSIFTRWSFGQVTVYTVLFQLLLTLLELPLDWYRHVVDVNYGVSNMTGSAWLQDLLTSLAVDTVLTIPVIWLALLFLKKSPRRWWLWLWLTSVPLTAFMIIIQPIVIDPLYNDFKPLQNQELKTKILDLAHRAQIPSDDVYEVDMSKKTNALNAYVNGIGPSARIVLWDTTLQKLNDEEILFIMGHEMGHYVKHHILWGFAGIVGGTLVLVYVIATLYRRIVHWMGEHWNIEHHHDLSAVPLVLLLVSVLNFASSPLNNYLERFYEHSADQYAVQITQDPQSGIRSFQKLARLSLSDPNPPEIVKFFRYTHPTISERIDYLEEQEKK
ncbi:M48 family metallopeptidase [Tumebacillus permanentifrigoris]|uniref:Zn-dependent protease with chaperone function n=1 Tax=Tumebacillus permanentifrigoris TaxID=378543 RepID=A0A316D9B5_9BACL|nr:M48 family metallopeptidase [Tumebacillus permanentifrigoris]PWK13350.1 Zn-dependent protease with chaperone function [Tumebacillus permanentifrigoris]